MSKTQLFSSATRLTHLIEVEVSDPSDPGATHLHNLHGLVNDPLKALEELAEKIEQLECEASGSDTALDRTNHEHAAKAISEMQHQMQRFQRQAAVLKRLTNKLH